MSTVDILRVFRMASSIDDLMSMRIWKAIGAEFTGTLFLVFVGCGSCISWPGKPDPSVVEIALTFGLGVGTMVWAICHVSGGHINPAVTVGMLATRKISLARGLLYILAQCTGAIAGAGFLKGVTPSEAGDKLGVTSVSAALSPVQGGGVEFLITFVLVFTVFATCDESRTAPSGSGPLAIGLSVTFCHLFAVSTYYKPIIDIEMLHAVPVIIYNYYELFFRSI